MPTGAILWLWTEASVLAVMDLISVRTPRSPGVTQSSPTVWHLRPQHCCRVWLYPSIPCVTLLPLFPQNQLEAHHDEGMVISHMAVSGVGIWIAFTSGSTLRLFHTETLKHLQDVNIDAPVHSMLPGTSPRKGGFQCHCPSTACRQVPQKGGDFLLRGMLKEQQGQQLLMRVQPVWTVAPGCSHVPCVCRCTATVCSTWHGLACELCV